MKLKNPRKKITSNLILEKFFNSDAVKELQENLNSDLKKIHFQGNVGSSFAVYSASILSTSIQNHVFILKDKEEALYFINDLENIIKKAVLFLPASHRRSFQLNESNNSNILLRSEVLNKLNNSKKNIIITYPEALFEKVISKSELIKKTISLEIKTTIEIEKLESLLEKEKFEAVDFVTDPGQYSIRGGIVDIFSYANEHPYRIVFDEDEIESIRTFNINSQLSISEKKRY